MTCDFRPGKLSRSWTGWTVVTADGSWAAHSEHTFAITADGLWVLTALDGGEAELAARGGPGGGRVSGRRRGRREP